MNVTIHESVQAYYGAAVQKASCCGEDANCCNTMYEIQELPQDVASFGCGDPVTIATLKAGETVLDLGSGAGFDTFLAARQVGEGGKVIGVDMTPAMLEKARANQQRLGFNNIEFREGYIEKLPVADNSVDVIMSNCVINLSPDKAAVFQEAYRVLKPGGRVSVSDIVTKGEFAPEARANAEQWAACVTGAIDMNEYTGLMAQAGFVNIQVVDKTEYVENVAEDAPRVFSARITAEKK